MDGNAALAVLGLRPGASRREIKDAFRRRAKLVHPDHDGAAEHFVVLHRAYRAALRGAGATPAADRAIPPSIPAPPATTLRPAPAPRKTRGWTGRWSTTPATPAATIDVLDVRRREASATPAFGRRPTTSFDGHLASALSA